ncbi:hypothetical protein KQI63_03810 [bacterium]|nr:hypothetical protein [bacterium]
MAEPGAHWRDDLNHAARDRANGALVIADSAAQAFARAGSATAEELYDALLFLVRGQRAMAPVLNLATRIEAGIEQGGPGGCLDAAQAFHKEVQNALLHFKQKLVADPPTPANHWGFFSDSSTVQAGMKALQDADLACASATVGYSEPGGEGQSAFEALKVKKELLYDSVLFEIAGKGWLDHLILGCDALDGRTFINKIGSGPLAQLANNAGSRVEIWTTTQKMVAPEAMPLFNVYDDAYDDIFEYTGWLSFGTGSLNHVDVIRCEEGAWTIEQTAEYCAKLPIPSDRLKAAILEMDAPPNP